MRYRSLLPSLLTLGAFGLAACGEETTQPNSAEDQPTAPQLAVTSNTWLIRHDMPLELREQATAVAPNGAGKSILYAIGGGKVDGLAGDPVPMSKVRAYNVATNTWSIRQDLPATRYDMSAEVVNGKIYVPGGYTRHHTPNASLFVYDIASDTWTRKRDMPTAGGGGVTGVIGGKLYVVTFGSYSMDPPVYFFRYNPTTDSWTTLPSPPNYSILGGGGGVINGKFYLIADRVLEFDPATNRWTTKRQSPGDLIGPSVVMLSHLYLFGDDTKTGVPVRGIFIYDPVSDTWETKPLLTTFSYWADYELRAARVFVNGEPRAEVIGGYLGGNNQQYIP